MKVGFVCALKIKSCLSCYPVRFFFKRLNCYKFSIVALLFFLAFTPENCFPDQNDIYIAKISSSINPGVVDYIKSGIQKASEHNASCIIIELDTPGGLAESMREIVMAILGSKVPVVVYVSPSGARAASAGVVCRARPGC